ncbi:hypothetical protein MKW94_004750 [Papaver nudicaule]|uniref:Bifunctional inhibitor/plant lipid transfer protein/seed storage helical domain-containing protein n=1 Tax=Papaver nudicaule TaxID=74823 RepID=A0AA41V7N4_PAPNU|nr:hypothetical protein [Papaver nudicaule]
MAAPMIEMVLLVLLATAFATRVTAQSSCSSVIMGMAPCLSYITGNSSSSPSSSCCSQLTNVVQTQPECLCTILNTGAGAALGIAINRTLALALPRACNVQTPSIDRCNAANGPAISPTNSPVGSLSPANSPTDTSNETPDSPIAPTSTSTPAGNGSKSTPTKDGDTSGGNLGSLHRSLVAFLFVVSCTSVLASF